MSVLELDQLKFKIIEEDYELYEKQVEPTRLNALKLIKKLVKLQNLLLHEVQSSISDRAKKENGGQNNNGIILHCRCV